MTQVEFASVFSISLGTLRHWERGDRIPRGPALVLLNLVSKDPQTILTKSIVPIKRSVRENF